MKEYKSLIADIRTEACELADKMKRLEVFMMSEDFCTISPEQKGLLEQQYDLMAKYKVTLVKRAHRINYEHRQNQGKEDSQESERMEPHVFEALMYQAHEKKKDRQKVPSAPPTFEVHPEMCATCIHTKGAYSTCHDCENGNHYSKKEEEPQELAQPSDCVNCKWEERIIKGEHITYACRNPDKTISRDKCFEARKY